MSKLIHKRSAVVGKIPTVTDLDYGELALNYADGRLFYKASDNTIKSVGSNEFAGLAVVASTGNFSDLNNKPTTLSGYGITDAATLQQLNDVEVLALINL